MYSMLVRGIWVLFLIPAVLCAEMRVKSYSFTGVKKQVQSQDYFDDSQSVFASQGYFSPPPLTTIDEVNLSLSDLSVHTTAQVINESSEPAILGAVFNYPNPFRLSEGTEIGYELNKDMDIEIQLYNMRGQKIWSHMIDAGEPGARGGEYEKFTLNQTVLGGFPLSSAVYFYTIVSDGQVLGKGKMMVKP